MALPKLMDETRTQELINEMKERLSKKVDKSSSPYIPGGSIAFAALPAAVEANAGMVYNITDAFTTTADFIEGADIQCSAGTDVAIVKVAGSDPAEYKYNIFSGNSVIDSITSAELAEMWKDAGLLTLSANTAALTSAGATQDITVTANSGTVTAVSSDTDVAAVSVDTSGTNPVVTITAVVAGSATVTVTSAATSDKRKATAEVAVSCTF